MGTYKIRKPRTLKQDKQPATLPPNPPRKRGRPRKVVPNSPPPLPTGVNLPSAPQLVNTVTTTPIPNVPELNRDAPEHVPDLVNSPKTSFSDPSNLKLQDIPPMTDEEIHNYFQTFELTPAEYCSETADHIPLTPPPTVTNNMPVLPTLETELNDDKQDKDFNIDDLVDYSVNSEDNENFDNDFTTDDQANKRRVPFFGFRDSQNKQSDLFVNASKGTLLAALKTMAADIQPNLSDDYLDSVLITANGFNQRSLMSGKARETMAPGIDSWS